MELTSGGASQIEPIDFMKEYKPSLEQFQTFTKLLAFTMRAFLATELKNTMIVLLEREKLKYTVFVSVRL